MSTPNAGPHPVDSRDGWNQGVGTTYDPTPDEHRPKVGASSVIGGPTHNEVDEIGQELLRAFTTHAMPPDALASLLGGLSAVARGPFGVASQYSIQSLRNAQKAVNR